MDIFLQKSFVTVACGVLWRQESPKEMYDRVKFRFSLVQSRYQVVFLDQESRIKAKSHCFECHFAATSFVVVQSGASKVLYPLYHLSWFRKRKIRARHDWNEEKSVFDKSLDMQECKFWESTFSSIFV